jgi:uncharacterized protein YdaU (DUF1376 family)
MNRPWMPLYVADYLADTAHLNAAEHGAYLLLIMHYWVKGRLPADEASIMRITRMTARQWSRSRDVLRSLFGDDWRHERIDEELAQAIEISRKRSANAQQKHSKGRAIAEQLRTQPQSQSQKKDYPADAGLASKVPYAFEAGVIRLRKKDFDQWTLAFSHLDLCAELIGLAPWATQQSNWFIAVSQALAKKNREALERIELNKAQPHKWNGMEGITSEAEVFQIGKHRGRHNQVGYFSLADLPQRPSIEGHCISTEWWELDQIFKLYRGQFVVVTGVAGHGKSTFVQNILVNVARKKDIRSFLYVPENEQHLREKLRKIWNDEASFPVFADRQCFVQSAVPDNYDDRPKTIEWVMEMAEKAVEIDGADIVMIDPWNELERAKPREMLLSDYIGYCLMLLKQFCRKFNVVVIMVAHPTKAVNEGGGRTPGLADIEGSMNWYNKCDNGLIVVRDAEKNSTRVISAKVREIGAGALGFCHFNVDPQTGIFTPQYGAVCAKS